MPIPKSRPLRPAAIPIIDGMLLGDMSLQPTSAQSARITLGTPNYRFAHAARVSLEAVGIKTRVAKWLDRSTGRTIRYALYSEATLELGGQRRRWYSRSGVKHLPKDLSLTADSWKWFYVCDGALKRHSKYSFSITLYGCAFTRAENLRIARLLNAMEVPARQVWHGMYPVVQIGGLAAVRLFLRLIGRPPSPSFNYKWQVKFPTAISCPGCGQRTIPLNGKTNFCCRGCARHHQWWTAWRKQHVGHCTGELKVRAVRVGKR